MRRHFQVHSFFILVLLNGPAKATPAQDAAKIIEQYVKAVGGSKALAKWQTLSIDGTFSGTGEAKPGTYSLRVKQPNRYYSEIRSDGKTLIESYNGKSAWHQTTTGEPNTLLGEQA